MLQPIYHINPSSEEDRPRIDFEAAENAANDWSQLDEALGTEGVDVYPSIAMIVDRSDAHAWDAYSVPGTHGVYSQRFVDAVGEPALSRFQRVPCTLNGGRYYFLRCVDAVDCLDVAKSQLVHFRVNPSRIKQILRYSFNASTPAHSLFCIPQSSFLFATEDVVKGLMQSDCRGIDAAAVRQ